MGRFDTINISVDVDEVIDQLSDDQLIAELESRGNNRKKSFEQAFIAYFGSDLNTHMKALVIRQHLHKFSWLEICEIFENKKY